MSRIFLCLTLAILGISGPAFSAERKPNIVLIVSDDQGYHDLGSFGNEEIKTPHLDKLAREGVRLTDFYVTWPACTPSRSSILTGRYPQRNGLYDMIRNDVADFGKLIPPAEYAVSPERVLGMDTREITIAQALKPAGYACGVFGKWDGGQLRRYLPLQRGFDDFYGLVNTGIDYFTHERYGVPSMYRNNQLTTEDRGTYATDLIEREALRFIREHKQQPFFLYLPFNAPHGGSNLDPKIRGLAQAPEEYKKLYPHLKDGFQQGTRYGKPAQVPTREMRKLEYLACVTCMDDAIGEVLKALDEYHLAEDTLVIFFSDNGGSGDADNTPLRGHKGQMFEGGIRVPCIAKFPGRIPNGTLSHEFLTSLELFPTFCEVAGTALPPGVAYDGFNMLPVLPGKASSRRNEMYWERQDDQAARVGNMKWIRTPTAESLFDLSNDLSEKHNLAKSQPEKLANMRAHFDHWKQEMNAAEPRGPFRDY
jgi:arylsulfatase A-like enzyme